MAVRWYFAQEEKQFGPFSSAQLQELAASGQVQPRDTVWTEGMDHAVLAARVKHLFRQAPAQARPAAAHVPAVPVPCSALESAHSLSSALPPPVAIPERSPTLADAQAPPVEPMTEIIPADLLLKGIPEESDSDASVAAAPTGGTELTPPGQAVPSPSQRSPQREPVRQQRVVGAKGAVILSQDRGEVRYRKKCLRCGHEDVSRSTLRIRPGHIRVNFFCPKCRKMSGVEMYGIT
jgi:GYF domain 2